MKFLIAGLGSVGRRHLRNLLALGERDILLYRTFRSTLPDDELAGLPVETDARAALARKPAAVIIANPTACHLDVAIPAAAAGCHLLLEKPVSHSWEGIPELLDAARRGGGKVLVGFQYRFHPGLRRAASLIREGTIGRLLSVRAHWGEFLPDWHPWEDYRQSYSARRNLGGGVILTLCHPFDYLRWLMGEVEALWSFAGQLSDLRVEVEDSAEIGLRFVSGALGGLHLNYYQRPHAHWLEIVGTGGTIRWDHSSSNSLQLYTAKLQTWQNFPLPEGFERNTMFLDEMRHFLDLVRGLVEPACSLEDGLQALKLALAAHRSAVSGRLVEIDA